MQEAAYGATLLLLLMLDGARERGIKHRNRWHILLIVLLVENSTMTKRSTNALIVDLNLTPPPAQFFAQTNYAEKK